MDAPGHTPKVSAAIQAALHDINLLRPLTQATSDQQINAILAAYHPPIHLDGTELEEFGHILRDGKATITAKELVGYYDDLQPPKILREMRGKEWVP